MPQGRPYPQGLHRTQSKVGRQVRQGKNAITTSVLKWQTKAAEQKTTPRNATPPTLHVKSQPETRFQILAGGSESDEDSATLRHYRFTLHDDDDADNYVYIPMVEETILEEEFVPPPLTVTVILADVDRQLADHPMDDVPAPSASGDVDTDDDDHAHLVRMDTRVRAIMAGANPRILALNTALGHAPTSTPLTRPYVTTSTPRSDLGVRYEDISRAMEGSNTTPYEPRDSRVEDPPLSPLTIERINAEIAECYAYYYAETSSEDEIPVDPLSERRPPTPYHVPDSPLSDSPSTQTTHDDITYALSKTSLVLSRPSLPTPITPTLEESSSSSPHRPRRLFRYADDNKATGRSTPVTTRYARPPPAATISETPLQWGQGPIHAHPAPQLAAAPSQWGQGPLHFEPTSVVPWQPFQEPQPWASRPRNASSDSNQEEDEFPLSSYVQTRSSFQGGTTVNATGFVRDPLNNHQITLSLHGHLPLASTAIPMSQPLIGTSSTVSGPSTKA